MLRGREDAGQSSQGGCRGAVDVGGADGGADEPLAAGWGQRQQLGIPEGGLLQEFSMHLTALEEYVIDWPVPCACMQHA